MKKAKFYKPLDQNKVQCFLCPHECTIADGKIGICGVRQNIKGTLYSLVYERAIATHVDPIEKKPLFHVYPSSRSFSVATVGCNFRCMFCQNHDIAQMPHRTGIAGQEMPVDAIVTQAEQQNCKTIACTYTEPTIFYEYAYDIAKSASEKLIETVFISNGYISPEPVKEIAPYLSAANVDLKGWDEKFYRKVIGGDLQNVLETLKLLKKLNIWVEVTTLVVPGYVDNEESLRDIARFIKNELGVETPWHISRFHPQYKYMDHAPTSLDILQRGREIGLEEGLRYVYSGNVPGDDGEHTKCYSCGAVLIRRFGFRVLDNRIKNGACPECGAKIDGIGM